MNIKPWTIGQLIAALEQHGNEKRVHFDFCGCVPSHVDSWRGIYAEPALGWNPTGYSATSEYSYPTVGDLLPWLRHAIAGVTFQGWKGGEYTYTADSLLHVDNAGDCTNTYITGIRADDSSVIIQTAYDDPFA